ncbi:MAG: hypothetical protein WC542_06330, partial [Paludibacter sp.]
MKKNILKVIVLLLGVAFSFVSCTTEDILKSKYDYVQDATKLPTVMLTVGEITGASVACVGTSTFTSDSSYIERGFVCSTDIDFTTNVVSAKADSGSFTGTVNKLSELTEYYVKAYVITQNGIAYSEMQLFTTPLLKNPLLFLCGSYTETDYKLSDSSIEATYPVDFKEITGNTKQLQLINFWGGGDSIIVDVNLVTKTISLAPQVIYVDATYGDTKEYPLSSAGVVDKTGTPVLGTFDDNGV